MRSLCTYKDISPANQSCRLISNEFKWSWVAVQNPLVRMNAREKAASHKTHPKVLTQMEAKNEGNKRKMSETKVDSLVTKRKCQREEGRTRAIEYFGNVKEEKLTLADILFNSVKGGGCETKNATSSMTQNWPRRKIL